MKDSQEKYVDTGLKGVHKRLINDGLYTIVPQVSKSTAFSILKKNNSVIGSPLVNNADQFFIVKYNDEYDYYTFMSLSSHLFLGVDKKQNNNYDEENIIQDSVSDSLLEKWYITSDNGFNIQLMGTEYNICFMTNNKTPFLSKRNKSEEQKFDIVPVEIVKSGLYYINSISPGQSYITLSKTNKTASSFLSAKTSSENQVFYVVFDPHDGCYSFININEAEKNEYNIKCLSPDSNPTIESQIIQTHFWNLDSQKYIIGSYNFQKGEFFIILKANLLQLCNPLNNNNDNQIELKFISMEQNDPSINTCYRFQSLPHSLLGLHKSNEQKILDHCKKFIHEKMNFRYQQKIVQTDELLCNLYKLPDYLLQNNFMLESLEIPLNISDIHENALINCTRIKYIKCHPKWLKYLPNPSNVENIVVPHTVECIEKDYFQNFVNVKYLSLPESLKFNHCNPEAFQNIYRLTIFEGDPIFLKIMHKTEITQVYIPFFVKEIPEDAFAGCISLKEVQVEDDSKMKVIKSRAFAGCELLRLFSVPDSVENIAPDAFKDCNEHLQLIMKNDKQEASILEKLVINEDETKITNDYKKYININQIEIHLNVQEIEPDVLKSFKMLKCAECDPKWLNDFDTANIETVLIPDTITQLKKQDFDNLVHLKAIEIPDSVEEIEENIFENCKELESIKCSPHHFKYLNRRQITDIYINEQVSKLTLSDFEGFINLETITIPKTIHKIRPNVFANCKKLMKIDYPKGSSLIHNKISIDINKTEISKREFEGWTNLETLIIPNSITKIEEGTFDDCTNLRYLTCDPKWFPLIPKDSIIKVVVPEFVEVLEKGQFDDFYAMTELKLPKNITINDSTIFDNCKSLKIIKCSSTIFSQLSEKTIERCDKKIKMKYEYPMFNFQPDQNKIHDETNLIINNQNESNLVDLYTTNSLFFTRTNKDKYTTVDDLIQFDDKAYEYRKYINKVLWYIRTGEYPHKKSPKDTSLPEITDLCGAIFYEIINKSHNDLASDEDISPVKIVPRPIQIYAVLRLADEILNKEHHGSIAEIKTGEGKTLILAILAIILVKYGHTVDIITSNLQLARRDKHITSRFFDMFHIPTAVFYDRRNDQDLSLSATFSTPKYFEEYKEYDQSEFHNFNLKAFDCPVVYSTSRNFEQYYLHTLFSMIPRKRNLDVVLIDEVDNMLIDEIESPSMISKEINFAFTKNILCIIHAIRTMKNSEISKLLKKEFPNASDFNEDDIEILRNAALEAYNKIKDIDYIIENKKIIIIDPNTNIRMPSSYWPNYVYEMVGIKECIIPNQARLSFCQVTQQTYFNLYKKIAGVTGTIGNEIDQEILQRGYNIISFKVPRNMACKSEIFYKNRPESINELYDLVFEEIDNEVSNERPVLVIWDSKYNADQFKKAKKLKDCSTIDGVNPFNDQFAIENAGKPSQVTIATSAAGRGVDIKLSKESIRAGGLHVVIPMKISNLRSLEQAVGRAGRQGQPGSVTLFISKDDLYIKTLDFNQRNEYLDEIQREFATYIRQNYSWILCGPRKVSFTEETIFPFASNYSDILKILSLRIFYIFKEEILDTSTKNTKVLNNFQDYAWTMVQTAWGAFFTTLQNDKINTSNHNYCKNAYIRFIKELETYLSPIESKSIKKALIHIISQYNAIKKSEYFIYKGFSITENGTKIMPPIDNDGEKKHFTEKVGNTIKKILNLPKPVLVLGAIAAYLPFKQVKKNVQNHFKKNAPTKETIKKAPPKCVNQLDIDSIRLAMTFANEAYDGIFSHGNVILASEENDISKPKFYCVEYLNKLFVVTRGSNSNVDWITDMTCTEKCEEINGTYVYFHQGFYEAATYILFNISDYFQRNYEEICFVGHSYAAAVSNILCVLTKSKENFKDKKISSLAFAPPPSMSKIPGYIQDCIYSFINKYDIVPHCSLNNIKKTLAYLNLPSTEFVDFVYQRCKSFNIEQIQNFANFIEEHKKHIYSIFDNINDESHVQRNIGNLFHIGMLDTTKLSNCLVDETDLPTILFYQDSFTDDHSMTNYIETFKNIKSF